MANRGEKVEVGTDFLFLGSKITKDGDCSHEIRRQLLLGRKAMTPKECVEKQRCYSDDKGPYSQAMVFPVVTYSCESWTVKKAEFQRIDTFKTVVLEKTPKSPLDSKEIKPVNLKGSQP